MKKQRRVEFTFSYSMEKFAYMLTYFSHSWIVAYTKRHNLLTTLLQCNFATSHEGSIVIPQRKSLLCILTFEINMALGFVF